VYSIKNLENKGTTGSQNNNVATQEHLTLVHDKALEVLNTGNPIQFLKDEYKKIHVGDEDQGELLILSIGSQLCFNTAGLNMNFSGQSGKGKTDACEAMGFLLPEGYFISKSLSSKALLYMNLKEGSTVLVDDVDSFNEDMEQIVKSAISHFQSGYKHCSVDFKMQGSSKTKEVMIPPRTIFWLTSVHSSFDMQVLNRLIKVDVDESPEQNRRILEHVLDCAVTGKYEYTDTFEVEVCREMFLLLKQESPCSVSIPFATQLEKYPQIARNLKMFLDLVRASAALFQYQRNPSVDRCITATQDDLNRAIRLWKMINRAQTTGLTGEEQKVFDAIVAAGIDGISNKGLEVKTGLVKGSVSRAIHGKKQSGSGEHKGGLKNKVVGLLYDPIHKIWIYDGIIDTQSDTVGLIDSPKECVSVVSCSQLQQVAELCNPKKTT
jgi:hypothetical protein